VALPEAAILDAREITFPSGLIGLPALVHHRLTPVPETPLFELVSTDDPDFGFIGAPAEEVHAGMTADLRSRGLVRHDEELFVLLSVHGEPAVITANLAGPLAIDAEGTARQLVLEDAEYPLRAPVEEPS
jgi:flagellar assembly factor FliW